MLLRNREEFLNPLELWSGMEKKKFLNPLELCRGKEKKFPKTVGIVSWTRENSWNPAELCQGKGENSLKPPELWSGRIKVPETIGIVKWKGENSSICWNCEVEWTKKFPKPRGLWSRMDKNSLNPLELCQGMEKSSQICWNCVREWRKFTKTTGIVLWNAEKIAKSAGIVSWNREKFLNLLELCHGTEKIP